MTENLHRLIVEVMITSDETSQIRAAHQKPCGARRYSLEELLKGCVGHPQKGHGATLCSALTLNGTHLSVWIFVHFRLFRCRLKIKWRNAVAAFTSPTPSNVNDATVCAQQGSGT